MHQHSLDAPRLGLAGRHMFGMLYDVTLTGFERGGHRE